ncbi:hypothetical protein Dimus_023947 [Dionaea muscipula]
MAPAKTFTQEVESPVAPARLFKALVLDSHTLLPDLIPNSFDSVEIEEGDSIDIGSIKKFHFAEGVIRWMASMSISLTRQNLKQRGLVPSGR